MFVWNTDPVLLSIGPIEIRWYSLLFASSFIIGLTLMDRIFQREGINRDLLDPLLIYVALGTIIFARLGHCLIYEPEYFLSHPLEILKIWKGGLASHGGGTGMILAIYLFTLKFKEVSFTFLTDRITIPALSGAALVRTGNFFNSEIVGLGTSGNWGVIFARVDPIPRHPAQLYEAFCYLLFFILFIMFYRKTEISGRNGALSGLFLAMVFTARFFIDYIKVDQESYTMGIPIDIGQILSIPAAFLGLLIFLGALARKQNT